MTETRKIEKLEVKLSPADKLRIKADAKRMGQSLSDYARSLLLHEKSDPRASEIIERGTPLPERSSPDAPPRQTEAEEVEAFKEPEETLVETDEDGNFKRVVAKHKLKMGTKAAEAQAKKEMGLDA